jgi:ubiquinone/menaquinone biosynthesis C-methylase UbiE
MNPPIWMRLAIPKPVRNLLRPVFYRLQTKIIYSREFYEQQYHRGIYRLPERDLADLMAEWEQMGWKEMLFQVMDSIRDPLNPRTWLEVACHHGKTAFWLAERFPDTRFYMFDFSSTAVEFCRRNNPIPERSEVWLGEVSDIKREENRFSEFFDAATLLDVTEHLPPDIYLSAIREVYRVLKPGGCLLLKQGHEILPEHINILPERRLVQDFSDQGFELVQKLPDRHYLMKKPYVA